MITHKYALCRAKLRESDLLMGAINLARNAPVVPVPAQPAKPTRLTVDQAVARYLRNASTKSPRTFHGYTYTLTQFRQSCQKQFLDEINKQDLYDFVTYLRVQGLGDRTIHNRVEEVVGLLRHYDIMNITIKVKYTEKKISAYTREELRSLFAVWDPEDRLAVAGAEATTTQSQSIAVTKEKDSPSSTPAKLANKCSPVSKQTIVEAQVRQVDTPSPANGTSGTIVSEGFVFTETQYEPTADVTGADLSKLSQDDLVTRLKKVEDGNYILCDDNGTEYKYVGQGKFERRETPALTRQKRECELFEINAKRARAKAETKE